VRQLRASLLNLLLMANASSAYLAATGSRSLAHHASRSWTYGVLRRAVERATAEAPAATAAGRLLQGTSPAVGAAAAAGVGSALTLTVFDAASPAGVLATFDAASGAVGRTETLGAALQLQSAAIASGTQAVTLNGVMAAPAAAAAPAVVSEQALVVGLCALQGALLLVGGFVTLRGRLRARAAAAERSAADAATRRGRIQIASMSRTPKAGQAHSSSSGDAGGVELSARRNKGLAVAVSAAGAPPAGSSVRASVISFLSPLWSPAWRTRAAGGLSGPARSAMADILPPAPAGAAAGVNSAAAQPQAPGRRSAVGAAAVAAGGFGRSGALAAMGLSRAPAVGAVPLVSPAPSAEASPAETPENVSRGPSPLGGPSPALFAPAAGARRGSPDRGSLTLRARDEGALGAHTFAPLPASGKGVALVNPAAALAATEPAAAPQAAPHEADHTFQGGAYEGTYEGSTAAWGGEAAFALGGAGAVPAEAAPAEAAPCATAEDKAL
jgi:hypothetical protein